LDHKLKELNIPKELGPDTKDLHKGLIQTLDFIVDLCVGQLREMGVTTRHNSSTSRNIDIANMKYVRPLFRRNGSVMFRVSERKVTYSVRGDLVALFIL
jgi:hypothetical protein